MWPPGQFAVLTTLPVMLSTSTRERLLIATITIIANSAVRMRIKEKISRALCLGFCKSYLFKLAGYG